MNFKTISLNDGRQFELSNEFNLWAWAYTHGDSFCVVKIGDLLLLNINDCIVDSAPAAIELSKKIKKLHNKIDIMFTQFGYASWVGNEDDSILRKKRLKKN